ncbi:hypothetical protein PC116_g17937 [Phytophthora cactorum]|nr:hypothetical protein PC116_g17937 [Phytophthora cactorum]
MLNIFEVAISISMNEEFTTMNPIVHALGVLPFGRED